MSEVKLHILIYYCQAFSWTLWNRPMFDDGIEARAEGLGAQRYERVGGALQQLSPITKTATQSTES